MATRYAVVELDSVTSTQDEARARFESPTPVLVVADEQTAGRGRLGRTWVPPDRGMYASLAFEARWGVPRRGLIPLVAGLAMRSAVTELAGVTLRLRWPNDLVTGDGAKVGGILAESGRGVVIVGCGVNLSWGAPLPGASSLEAVTPTPVHAGALARAWAENLLGVLDGDPEAWGREAYVDACATLGRHVSYERGAGVAVGVGSDGALLVDTGDAIVPVHGGEARLHDVATMPGDRKD